MEKHKAPGVDYTGNLGGRFCLGTASLGLDYGITNTALTLTLTLTITLIFNLTLIETPGLDYGITNTSGMASEETAIRIIKTAQGLGVKSFDTAIAYGVAEQRLGTALQYADSRPCSVVSKIKNSLLQDADGNQLCENPTAAIVKHGKETRRFSPHQESV